MSFQCDIKSWYGWFNWNQEKRSFIAVLLYHQNIYIYIYITELKNNINHLLFTSVVLVKSKNLKKIGIDMTDCIRTLLNN